MDLSVIVVSYNVRTLLADCLTSVYTSLAHSPRTFEVWVVDNASRDNSVEMVRQGFPSVHLIENETNRGFAAATNQGIERSQGRYVLLLNPDTRVLDNAPEVMISFMEHIPHAGMSGAQLQYADGGFQHSAFHFPSLWQIFFDFFPLHHRLLDSTLNGRYPRKLYEKGAPFAIDHPLGAAMMVRREVISQVGLLDERFFIYCEEIDWAMRIQRAGWTIYCVPEAKIVHYAAQSTQQFRDQMFIALWQSRYLLFEKHYRPAFRYAARLIVRAGLWRESQRLPSLPLSAGERETRRQAYETVWRM